jgi:intein-encoded DNA endonuclease-like protein
MGFLSKFADRKVSKTKKKKASLTVKETLERDIEKQRKLLNGTNVTNAKGKTIRSWFKKFDKETNGYEGEFVPFVGISALFGDNSFSYKKGEELSILDELANDLKNGGLNDQISVVEKKLLEANQKAKAKRDSKKKEGK